MPLTKKFFRSYLVYTLVSAIAVFSPVNIAEAEGKKTNYRPSSNDLAKVRHNAKQFQLQVEDNPQPENGVAIESSESGAPSLRRQPAGGEKFEPRRIPLQIPFPKQPYRTSPSITIVNPSAYGASWGNAGVGIGFQERARFREASDGVIGLGFGLGDPQKNVGAQVGISLVDVSAPFRDGAINLKLHRRLPQDFSVAIGAQGLTTWGDTDGGSSVFGVATKRLKLREDRTKSFSEVYTTLGVGGGQFRSEFNINNGNDTIGVFGSLAVRVIQPVGFVAEWSGQDLTVGVPLALFRKLPLVIVPAVTDITGSAGDGTRFIVGLGYSFSF